MQVARTLAELAAWRAAAVGPVGFVPTMGALHAGHRSLMKIGREQSAQVVVSIFVNPLQFGAGEDLDRYPRTLEADLEVCEAEGVDLVFAPGADELYGPDRQITVHAGRIAEVLEGASRPGHFDGVLTVVAKLFHLVRPQVAVFGQKDAQQLACIQRMVADLNFGVEIVAAPTIRERDGLALSSRNRYLSPEQRITALALSKALAAGAAETEPRRILAAAGRVLAEASVDPAFVLDYLRLVDAATFAEIEQLDRPAILLVAARVGATRLIDNRRIG